MQPAITLEGQELLARELGAQATVQGLPALGAGPDLALCTAWVDITVLRAAALAGEALQGSSAASRFGQEVPAVGLRGPIVVAGTAIEAACTEQPSEVCHGGAVSVPACQAWPPAHSALVKVWILKSGRKPTDW